LGTGAAREASMDHPLTPAIERQLQELKQELGGDSEG